MKRNNNKYIDTNIKEFAIYLEMLNRHTESLRFKYFDERIKIVLFVIENQCFFKVSKYQVQGYSL